MREREGHLVGGGGTYNLLRREPTYIPLTLTLKMPPVYVIPRGAQEGTAIFISCSLLSLQPRVILSDVLSSEV